MIVTSFDMGQNTWGGFSEYLRVPASWVVPLPVGMNLRESMVYGTGGLTAGLCIEALMHHGIDPAKGEVVVTGSTGGVGSLAHPFDRGPELAPLTPVGRGASPALAHPLLG